MTAGATWPPPTRPPPASARRRSSDPRARGGRATAAQWEIWSGGTGWEGDLPPPHHTPHPPMTMMVCPARPTFKGVSEHPPRPKDLSLPTMPRGSPPRPTATRGTALAYHPLWSTGSYHLGLRVLADHLCLHRDHHSPHHPGPPPLSRHGTRRAATPLVETHVGPTGATTRRARLGLSA